MLKKNICYFKHSLKNSDVRLNLSNTLGLLVITRNANEKPNELMKKNQELLDLITTYKTLRSIDNRNNDINKVIDKIINITIHGSNNIHLNYSPFYTYLNVLNYSYCDFKKDLKKLKDGEKRELLKCICDAYIDNRHNVYNSHGYSNSMLQIRADDSTSRTNSITANKQIESLIEPYKIKITKSYNDFVRCNKACIWPDRGNKDIFDKWLDENHIDYRFNQGKRPDCLIKFNDKYLMIEHKIVNSGGGHQNEQINETIDFINRSIGKNIYLISCLAGDYFNKFNCDSMNISNKIEKQKDEIVKSLKNNTNSYYLNGEGLKQLFKDLFN